jgi:hypothetical protein
MKTINSTLDYDYSLINHVEAQNEGWDVFYTSIQDSVHNIYELQRVDEGEVFSSDDEAILFVVEEAIKDPRGNHSHALLFLAKHSPNEVDSVIRSVVGGDKFKALKEVMRYTEFDEF